MSFLSDPVYQWKRFWGLREGKVSLSDGGYLYDPDSDMGKLYNAGLLSFSEISATPCLVLLGEPGIGKTRTIRMELDRIKTGIEEQGGQIIWLDLRSYGSEDRLIADLFQNPVFDAWTKGKYTLHLFLDSLDECLLRIDNLALILIDGLNKCPVERLFLRIVCRTAEWPSFLEKNLRRIWTDDALQVYELAPLRRVDVTEAARASSLDPEAFLHEIDRKEVVPLATKPVTLKFLLNVYHKKSELSSTQSELYLQGCRLLCEETSESRIAAGRRGSLTGEQKMTVASRIAAVSIFSNRYAVWTGINQGDVPDTDVDFRELCGGFEEVNDQRFMIDEQTIRETLSTGLFSSRGPDRIGWTHQTYAEFLAARYLAQNKLKLTQIMSLIVHPGDPEKKLVPQLHGMSLWLSVMVPEVLSHILTTDPDVLLRSDVVTGNLKYQAALVKSLLKLADDERILDLGPDTYRYFSRLNYPELPNDLRPYICDRSKVAGARRIAIKIAQTCRLAALEESIADVATDISESLDLRTRAAYAIASFGSEKTKKRMRVFTSENQPDDELRGCGFLAVWPSYMSAEELFSLLTPPKKENFIGIYQIFLFKNLVDHVQPRDLPLALDWVDNHRSNEDSFSVVERVGDLMLQRAWNHIETPGVVQAFAKTAFSRLMNFKPIFEGHLNSLTRTAWIEDNEKRHKILVAMVPMIEDPEKDSVRLVFFDTPMVLDKDLPWMIEQLRISAGNLQRTWTSLIRMVFNWREQAHLEIIFEASKNIPILSQAFSWFLKPVVLGSKEAQKMKEDYLREKRILKQMQDRPLLEPSPAERISLYLSQCESDNFDAWWRLNMAMTLESNSTHYGDELNSDMTVLPGWKNADETTKRRIVEAAKKYLLESDPQTKAWLGTNKLHRPAFAGFRSLRLLYQRDPDFLISLPVDVWRKWASIILAYPTVGNDEEIQKKIIKIAYQYASDEIIETLTILIDKENEASGHIFIIDKIEDCCDERLAKAMLSKMKDEKMKPESIGNLLDVLLKSEVDGARIFAESLIPLPVPSGEIERSKAILAARTLISNAGHASWSVVWSAIQQNVEFGREVVSAIVTSKRQYEKIEAQLTEDQLADLFVWLVHQYPYEEDPEHEGVYFVGPREAIADFRDSIVRYLEHLGTIRGCEAIRRIAQEFPELGFLKWAWIDAKRIARSRTWTSPKPADILNIARNQELRLVQNGEDLLDILIESLRRLEVKLQDETPAAIDLWDEVSEGKFRPKDENRLSDYVKRHLEEDIKDRGIIVNREVEIRRGEGAGSGERTDIHVDAIIESKDQMRDSISAIIEVKGCWYRELELAMKKQLVDRYLKDNRCQYGLYLIGWFNCQQWDDGDYRKGQVPKLIIGKAQEQYGAKASELSQGDLCIKALVINTALR
jgi:predicted NACHT family NTPase